MAAVAALFPALIACKHRPTPRIAINRLMMKANIFGLISVLIRLASYQAKVATLQQTLAKGG